MKRPTKQRRKSFGCATRSAYTKQTSVSFSNKSQQSKPNRNQLLKIPTMSAFGNSTTSEVQPSKPNICRINTIEPYTKSVFHKADCDEHPVRSQKEPTQTSHAAEVEIRRA